ncbi:MAG: glycosyltransferase, partial [Bdellovibrionales bacterium]|nr:glycosyltransferase [Bdellovibrionales bacterium]
LPNVVLEALVSEKPVIATTVGAVPELLKDGKSGILVESHTAEGIEQGIVRALQDFDGLRAGAGSALDEQYSPQFRADCFLKVYRELCAEND